MYRRSSLVGNESYIRDPSTDLVLSLDTVRLPLGPLDSNVVVGTVFEFSKLPEPTF